MQTKAPAPITYLRQKETLPIIKLYFEFNQLKQLYRQGWLRHEIPPEQCETVAEHSFGVAVLALLLAEPPLDLLKVMRLALLHDFGEIYAGDITPADEIPLAQKQALERGSMRRVLGRLPDGEAYIALWEEYEAQASAEARFVQQIDRLEMVLQAAVYEHQQPVDLSEFFASGELGLDNASLQEILQELERLRKDISK